MFKSIAEFEKKAQPLSQAEQALIAACRKGKPCTIGDGTLPPEGNKDKALQIRASLLRILIRGGTPECGLQESGVMLFGAHITETLDLRFATGRGQVTLDSCRFDEKPQLFQARLDQLSLDDSHFPGLFAQGAKIAGSVFLQRAVTNGTVDVNSAEIGGQLACVGASFDGGGGIALNAQAANIRGGLFLNATEFAGAAVSFAAQGTVFLAGAEIGGLVVCDGARLDGAGRVALNAQGAKIMGSLSLCATEVAGKATPFAAEGTVDLNGAEICGQLACEGASFNAAGSKALSAQGMRVDGGFIFRKIALVTGRVDLNTAHVSTLADDAQSWLNCRDGLILDGMTYDRITGAQARKTFAGRKSWLEKGSTHNSDFSPQPYTQLAKVFRAAGDIGEARKVLMERDRLLFEHALKPKREAIAAAHKANGQYPVDACLLYLATRAWGWLTRVVVGYGHAPQRALGLACWAVLIGFLWFMLAWRGGIMVPNSAVILTSADWLIAMGTNPAAPAHDWTLLPSGQHYETFYALAYALDVFVPLVSIGQESAWAATTADWFGWGTRIFTIAYQIAGWVITSLGIAAVTGFVQRGGPD